MFSCTANGTILRNFVIMNFEKMQLSEKFIIQFEFLDKYLKCIGIEAVGKFKETTDKSLGFTLHNEKNKK